jgi:Zn-dependent protease with chaperone function
MFGNFLYFILVLLIIQSYPVSMEPHFRLEETLLLLVVLSAAYAGFVRLAFLRVERLAGALSPGRLERHFQAALLRASVAAVVVFAVAVYGLCLPSFLAAATPFAELPTLLSAAFLLLFLFYLSLAWTLAYDLQRRLHRTDFTRREYVGSNISFSIPILLPWLLISGLADLLEALPFPGVKRLLATTEGQVAYLLLILFAIAVFGPLAIKAFWRCTPLPAGAPRRRIEALCERARLAYADILAWPLFGGKMLTAGVMGLVKRFRYILVTPALMSLLTPEEIDAVVAHEIGHIKRRHLVFYLFFFAAFMLVSLVAFDGAMSLLLFVEPFWWLIKESGINPAASTSILFGAVVAAVFLVYFRFVFGFFMRNFERQADAYVYTLFDSALPLITTLRKIAWTTGQSDDHPNWHHYSIAERIDFLARCEADPRWIARHDAKVRRGIGVYAAALALLGLIGYQLHMGEIGTALNSHLLDKMVRREIERAPDNPHLHALLGDLSYQRRDYAGVRRAYERALALKPDNASVLNNLAWLLATSEDPDLRDPPRALALAQAAADLAPEAFILDTLAEAYYANRRYAEAVAAAERALAAARGDRRLYERQLEKFRRALAENR